MDKEGVRPDVLVEPLPDQLAKGEDAQLAKAVEVLQADVAEWKKKNPPAVAIQPNLLKPLPSAPRGWGRRPRRRCSCRWRSDADQHKEPRTQ